MASSKAGVLGLHVIANAGASNENIAAYADILGGKYAVVVNGDSEHKLINQLRPRGITIIGRNKTPDDGLDDDDQDSPTRPPITKWVGRLAIRYPHPDDIWTCGNELGTGTPERTAQYVEAFTVTAAANGHRVCAYNTSVQNPTDRVAYWYSQRRALAAIKSHGGIVGIHRGERPGFEGIHALEELELDIRELQKYGVEIVITELCGSEKPDYGYQYYYSNSEEAVVNTTGFASLMAKYGVHGVYYTYTDWASGHGFGFQNDDVFKRGLILINSTNPVKEPPVQNNYPALPAATDPRWKRATASAHGTFVNVRSTPVVAGVTNKVGEIRKDQQIDIIDSGVGLYPVPEGTWLPVKLANGVIGWARNDVFDYALSLPASHLIPVPYFSQWNHASGRTGLCGPACVRMIIGADRTRRTVKIPPEITVDRIGDWLGLGKNDTSYLVDNASALVAYGVDAWSTYGMNWDKVKAELDLGFPVICLGDYGHLSTRDDQGYQKGHILVARGYDSQYVYVNDPDTSTSGLGSGRAYKLAEFKLFLSDTRYSGNVPNQAILVRWYKSELR